MDTKEQAPIVDAKYVAPNFTTLAAPMVNGEFSEVTLYNELKAGSWVVLFFYPLDFTFVCPTEIMEFSNKAADFAAAGAKVYGCSVDSRFTHNAWIETPVKKGGLAGLNIPLLEDLDHSISKAYGVLREEGHTNRATFIIDPCARIRHISINSPEVGRNVDEVLRLVNAFQYADAHEGEACPVNWNKGSKTITAHPDKKLAFFQSEASSSSK